MPTSLQRYLVCALVWLTALLPLAAQGEPNRNVRFGLPAPAKADGTDREALLIERPQYVLSSRTARMTEPGVARS